MHGNDAAPDDKTPHARFPHPLPVGEGADESLREFHVNLNSCRTFYKLSAPRKIS
ncbi:hypothetical protein NTG1052_210077 [Candidatus Nitrotoga sp. 1052]|nr:hypothetical protein NTG1052_210077 [Candidatus Nitrotoga sp. 1052]